MMEILIALVLMTVNMVSKLNQPVHYSELLLTKMDKKLLYPENMRHRIVNIYKDVVKLLNKENSIMLVRTLMPKIIFTKQIVDVIILLAVVPKKLAVTLFTREAIGFSTQGAVSSGARIHRLKHETVANNHHKSNHKDFCCTRDSATARYAKKITNNCSKRTNCSSGVTRAYIRGSYRVVSR